MIKRNLFIFFMIALFGFAVSLNFIGCKKEKTKDISSIEETSEDDLSIDEEEVEEGD
ncbi:MAG: hypothetical protein JXN64_02025 [Spirochaetes bacterium]|nr:hypothetical protein [Spirochaetota bacterium]